MIRMLLLACLLATCGTVQAELTQVLDGGFTTSHSAKVDAAPERVYQVLTGEIANWWEADHSWSGDAANLYVDASPGGCFCERLPGGGWVEHLRIIYLEPNREIRLRGSLGPLMQMGVQGTMTWMIEPIAEGGSTITFTYNLHGHLANGFAGIAPAVDGVIGAQLANLELLLASD
jgi:uncharacterized protein YndB with AHSA1/START domain